MKKTLDLSGLKLVLIGYIFEILGFLMSGSAFRGMMNGANGMFTAVMAVACLGMLLVWAGLVKLRNASFHFRRVQVPVLIRVAIAAILAIAMGIMGGAGGWSVDQLEAFRQNAVKYVLVILAVGVVWVICTVMTTRRMLRACGSIAEMNDDPQNSLKCLKTWRRWSIGFMLLIFALLLAAAIITNVAKNTLQQGLEGEDLYEALSVNIASSIVLANMIFLIALIVFTIVHIMFLVRIRFIRKTYDGSEVEIPTVDDLPEINVEWKDEEDGTE